MGKVEEVDECAALVVLGAKEEETKLEASPVVDRTKLGKLVRSSTPALIASTGKRQKRFEDTSDDDEEDLDEALGLTGDEDAEEDDEEEVPLDEKEVEKRASSKWSYKKARWVGE